MKKFWQLICLGLLAFSVGACSNNTDSLSTTIATTEGDIIGIQEGDILSWRGVPYAKAPVGDLRFAPPVSPGKRTTALDCKEFAPYAIQSENDKYRSYPSEDCLYLNIWAPKNAKNAPVYFFIHGGAYFNGAGSYTLYDGTNFAKNGIVTVTINYRLGTLGFLS